MSFFTALKVFWKAWRHPVDAQNYLEGKTHPELPPPQDLSHIRLLAFLQQKGRLIDFLQEDISECTDEQLGAAARVVHEECRKKIDELLAIRPILEIQEGGRMIVPQGYDSSKIRVIGQVTGEPPYTGKVVHPGWQAGKRSLPQQNCQISSDVIAPAEVEVGG